MSSPNVTLRISGGLRDHIEECTGEHGLYETPSEYLRDLVRRDMEKNESEKWERLRMAITEGLSAKDSDYKELSAAGIKKRARKRNSLFS
jgi:Arc/MetJ-type ribon-helix-helix transcriptional regulator